MFPEQNGVRPVTLHGDLVSVTERRVNGPRCDEQVWNGPTDRLQMSLQPRQHPASARKGGSDEAPRLSQAARPGGGWVGVRFSMTWGSGRRGKRRVSSEHWGAGRGG